MGLLGILAIVAICVILFYRPKENSMYENWHFDYGYKRSSKCGKHGSRMRHHKH